MKARITFSRSSRWIIAWRMCSCGKPIVWPASWRTTRWNSESGVLIVNASRFMVGRPGSISRTSVPRFDQ